MGEVHEWCCGYVGAEEVHRGRQGGGGSVGAAHGEAGGGGGETGGGVAIPLCTCETLCGRPSGMSFIWVAIKRGAFATQNIDLTRAELRLCCVG